MYVNPAPHSSPLKWYARCLQEARQTVCRMDAFILRLSAEARLQYWSKFDIIVHEDKRLLQINVPGVNISIYIPDCAQDLIFLRVKKGWSPADFLMKTERAGLKILSDFLAAL